MGDFWTVMGITIAAVGALIASAAFLSTLRGRRVLTSSLGTSATLAVARPNQQPSLAATTAWSKLVGTAAMQEDADLVIGRTLRVAQRNATEVERAAQARADEIVANAEAIASSLLQSARDEASQILENSRGEAEAAMASTKQQAAAWLTLLKTEADRMVLSAYMAFREAQRSVEQDVRALPSELERRVAEWAADLSDGVQETSLPPSSLHTQAGDSTAGLARSLASAEGVPATLSADIAVAPPSKNGYT